MESDGEPGGGSTLRFELGDQFGACIDPRVRDDVQAIIEAARLRFRSRFPCGAQHGVAQADVVPNPNLLRVRTAECQKPRHAFQQRAIDRSAVQIQNAHNSAHEDATLRGELESAFPAFRDSLIDAAMGASKRA